jgi:hypothetical protein
MSGAIPPLPHYVFMAQCLSKRYVFMAWCLVKVRDVFTFYLTVHIKIALAAILRSIKLHVLEARAVSSPAKWT